MTEVQDVLVVVKRADESMLGGANLNMSLMWWWAHGLDVKVVDKTFFDEQALREFPETAVFVFVPGDTIVPIEQLTEAIEIAQKRGCLVMPLDGLRVLSAGVTTHLRDTVQDMEADLLAEWFDLPAKDPASIFDMNPERIERSVQSVRVITYDALRQKMIDGRTAKKPIFVKGPGLKFAGAR